MSWPLETFPKGFPETIDMRNLIFGQVPNPSLWQDTPEEVILQGTWRILHSKRILHALSTIRVHDGFWSVISLEIEQGAFLTHKYLKICVMHFSPLLILKLKTCSHFAFRKFGRLILIKLLLLLVFVFFFLEVLRIQTLALQQHFLIHFYAFDSQLLYQGH